MRDPVTLTISRKGKEGVNKRESGKMERYVSWPCHNVRTMFIEQPASLSLPRSSSENQSRKEKKNGRGKNNGLIQCFSLAPFWQKCVAGEKIGNEKRLWKKEKKTKDFIEKIKQD